MLNAENRGGKSTNTFWPRQLRPGVGEAEGLATGPGDRSGFGVEPGLPQDRVVRPFLEVDVDLIFGDANRPAGLDDLPAQPLGLRLGEAIQFARQPAIAPVGQDRQGRIQIDVERDFAGQAVEMEEVDAAPQRILDPVAARVARDDLPSGLVEVVGQDERGLVASQAGDGNLSQFPLVVGDVDGLLKIPDVPMAAVSECRSRCVAMRNAGWLARSAEDSAPAPSDGDERRLAAGVESVHLGVGREPRIEVDPGGVRAQDRPAELDELQQLSRGLVANDGRVRVAQEPGFHGLSEEREDAGDGLATHRHIVVFQPVVFAAMRDRSGSPG